MSLFLAQPGKALKPSDLVNLLCLVPTTSVDEAAKSSVCNWLSFPGFRWDTQRSGESTQWALFPIAYSGCDLIRQANWLSLQDTLSTYSKWQAEFMRFKHHAGVEVLVLGVRVTFGDIQHVAPAFRLFFEALPKLQKNQPLDDDVYQELWEDALAEHIRQVGQLYANPACADDNSYVSGTTTIGWPTRVMQYLMRTRPELLAAPAGTIPTLKEHDVMNAMADLRVLAPELMVPAGADQEPSQHLLVEG